MKHVELAGKIKIPSHWTRLAAVSLIAVAALAGCGGGSDGANGANGANGTNGTNGTNGKDLVAVTTVPTNSTTASATATASWAALAPQLTVTSVTINSPPVVKFTVKDAAGQPVVGLGNKSQSSTATVPGLVNIAFTLAKLVPGSNNEPSKWVSYLVTRPVTVKEKGGTVAATAACDSTSTPTVCGTYPTSDKEGSLVDNGDGSYQYTFYRDPKQAKTLVASLKASSDGTAKPTDLGDVTFDATLTHRLGIQLGGAAPGTGSNTPDGVTLTPSVNMVNPANVVFDFRPDGAPVTAMRELVKVDSCNSCHDGQVLAHGSRKDPNYCVTCHTDQVKYSMSDEATPAGAFTLTGTTNNTTSVLDGRALGNFPNMLHKVHMGKELVKQGYFYKAAVKFNEVTYPQPVTNCAKCHDGATVATKPVNGDNWKTVPSALACGSCHDGINFATGKGSTLADAAKDIAAKAAPGTTQSGHVGGAWADNSTCVLCHKATTIPVYHVSVDPTGANGRGGYPLNTADNVPTDGYLSGQGPAIPLASQLSLPAGVYKIGLEIKSVDVVGSAGAKKAKVVYRVLKDNSPVTLNTSGQLITGVDGTPDIYVAYGLPQDGQASDGSTVVDWNTTQSVHVSDVVATQGTPDASGWYTVTVNKVIPDNAKLVTVGLGINYNGFVQLDNAAYPKGIRLREPQFAMMTATGYTARRAVVDNAKCNSCHGQLGVMPSFHSGARNNGAGCAMCHTPNTSTGHTGPTNSFGGGWSVSSKNLIHGIHASGKRGEAFTYEATAENPLGFKEVTYPGKLKDCLQCHVAGSYDFSATANKAAMPNLLWTTEAKTDMTNNLTTNPTSIASIGLSPWITTLGLGQVDYTNDNLVSSPISSSCFGCHDSAIALSHMQLNGGTLYKPVSTVAAAGGYETVTFTATSKLYGRPIKGFSKVESCAVCHAAGNYADISVVHK